MKRKFITMLTITTMTLSLLVGCGQLATPNTNEDTNTEQNTEVDTEVENMEVETTEDVVGEEPTTETDVEVPEVEVPEVEVPEVETPTEEPTTEDEFYSDSYQWAFPESLGVEGFTDKFVIASDETWSFNCTHYVDPKGNEINFTWEGPTELGESAGLGSNGTTIILKNSAGEYALRAFTTGELSPETYDEIASYDKETIISFAPSDAPYVPDGYYNANIGDTNMSFTYAIQGEVSDREFKGYAHYILDKDYGLCYQFYYLEETRIYDDARAMKVVNSLEYWDEYTAE